MANQILIGQSATLQGLQKDQSSQAQHAKTTSFPNQIIGQEQTQGQPITKNVSLGSDMDLGQNLKIKELFTSFLETKNINVRGDSKSDELYLSDKQLRNEFHSRLVLLTNLDPRVSGILEALKAVKKSESNKEFYDDNIQYYQKIREFISNPNVLNFNAEIRDYLILSINQHFFSPHPKVRELSEKAIDCIFVMKDNLVAKTSEIVMFEALNSPEIQIETLNEPNGNIYVGQCKNGQYHGYGKLTVKETGTVYEGLFQNGKLNGRATAQYKSGDFYDGQWNDGKRSGHGFYIKKNGFVYDVNWVDHKMHGFGMHHDSDGTVYGGYWKDNNQLLEIQRVTNRNPALRQAWQPEQAYISLISVIYSPNLSIDERQQQINQINSLTQFFKNPKELLEGVSEHYRHQVIETYNRLCSEGPAEIRKNAQRSFFALISKSSILQEKISVVKQEVDICKYLGKKTLGDCFSQVNQNSLKERWPFTQTPTRRSDPFGGLSSVISGFAQFCRMTSPIIAGIRETNHSYAFQAKAPKSADSHEQVNVPYVETLPVDPNHIDWETLKASDSAKAQATLDKLRKENGAQNQSNSSTKAPKSASYETHEQVNVPYVETLPVDPNNIDWETLKASDSARAQATLDRLRRESGSQN